jgi:hypothetical protein
MSSLLILVVAVSVLAGASITALAGRRRGAADGAAGVDGGSRAPIVINLPPDARMRLVREQGLSYALEVDDTVRITGIGVTQMTRVATSLVGPRRPGRAVEDEPAG